ncbi:MAG: glycosyltransferase [Candidatus Kapaibacterium sp.]
MSHDRPAYDLVILALADLRFDARTMNIAAALSRSGLRVACVAPDVSGNAVFDGVHTVYVPTKEEGRLWTRWRGFTREVLKRSDALSARAYWAADLWTLRAARRCGKTHGAPVVYDARELYSALGPLNERPVTQFFVSMMERVYAGDVDRIVVSGELDAEYVRLHLRREDKPDVILNVPPSSEVGKTDLLRRRCGIPEEHRIVIYQGAVLEGRGIGLLLDALAYLPGMHACILGEGPAREPFMRAAAAKPWHDRIHFLGNIPNAELAQWTASADVGMCFIEPRSLSYRLALPHKLFEYAMARIPALVSDLPAMRRVIERFPFGELVATTATAEECARGLQTLVDHADRYVPSAQAAAAVFNREAQEDVIVRVAMETLKNA